MARLREQEDGQTCGREKEPAAVWTLAGGGVATLTDWKGPDIALQSPVLEGARAGHETCQDPKDTRGLNLTLPAPETTDPHSEPSWVPPGGEQA